jgi:hypothetical protein
MAGSDWARIRKLVISLFVSIQLLIIVCRLFPQFEWQSTFYQYVQGYVAFLGFDQDWSVFAPKPIDQNIHLIAVVEHQDGTEELWAYPRMEKLDLLTRMFKERYRKFGHDNVANPRWKAFLPDLARFVARQVNDAQNPPIMVSILKFSSPIPEPPEEFNKKLSMEMPPQSNVTTLIDYRVKAEDLL